MKPRIWLIILFALIILTAGVSPYSYYTLSGNSMAPALHDGDIAIVKTVSLDSLKAGDVIVFKVGDTYYVHRIYQAWPEVGLYITKGDSSPAPDPILVSKDYVKGKVVGMVNYRKGQLNKWYDDSW